MRKYEIGLYGDTKTKINGGNKYNRNLEYSIFWLDLDPLIYFVFDALFCFIHLHIKPTRLFSISSFDCNTPVGCTDIIYLLQLVCLLELYIVSLFIIRFTFDDTIYV